MVVSYALYDAAARMDALQTVAGKPINLMLASKDGTRIHYEALFKSLQLHLVDAVTSEFYFDREFFGQKLALDIYVHYRSHRLPDERHPRGVRCRLARYCGAASYDSNNADVRDDALASKDSMPG